VPPVNASGAPYSQVTPVNIEENPMDAIGVRQLLEIVPPQEITASSERMILTDDNVHAAETPLTERWIQDVSCLVLWVRFCPTGAKYYWCGKDGQSKFKYVGSSIHYQVAAARTKAKWLTEGVRFGTIQRTFRTSMHIQHVVLEYLQETDPNNPLTPFFDHLLPGYGHSWLTRIDTERWLSVIKDASKDLQIDHHFLHKLVKGFLGWAVKRQLLRRNPLSGTSVVKPPSSEDLDGDRLFRLLLTPSVPDSIANSPDSPPE
jgi:hypothetical protein